MKRRNEMAEERKRGLDKTPDRNPDPITGEPGAHPVGVGAGSAGGAVAGAAVGGAVGGPVGAVVGGVVGAVAGGYAGKGAAETVNPTEEDTYWKSEYQKRPYFRKGNQYDYYGSAYRYGWENAVSPSYAGRSFEQIESDLERGWGTYRGTARSEWRDIREATRDSFSRVRSRLSPGVTSSSEKKR
jgi:hypothetical protein